MKKNMCFVGLVLILIFSTACGSQHEKDQRIIIADQFGLAYAPIEIMKDLELVEKQLNKMGIENVVVEWKRFGNTAAIREAMLSGNLDVGFVGIPPYLIGKDNGMEWRIISGLSQSPVGLVASKEKVSSLEDIDLTQKIILPQPGSIQHILLAMTTERLMEDPKYFDQQLMSMSHPDGMVAMLAHEDAYLHFTTPPFLQQELTEENLHQVLSGRDAFGGEFTFIVAISQESFFEERAYYQAFKLALEEAVNFLNDTQELAIDIIAAAYDYDVMFLKEILDHPEMVFEMDVKGIETFTKFMHRTSLLTEEMKIDDLFWEPQDEQ